ncbi:MAG: PAS domain S-box protein [bacterium]|nr:PAS domain S-box protein [bacterium]
MNTYDPEKKITLWRKLIDIIAIAIVYYITARLEQYLAILPGSTAPARISLGIALAAVLIRGYHTAPGIFLGAFAAYITTSSFAGILPALFSASANGIGYFASVVLGVYLLTRTTGAKNPFLRVSHILLFILFGVILTPAISALCGMASPGISGNIPWSSFAGNAAGVIITAPLIISLWSMNGSIIEQKKTKNELADSEHRYRRLLDLNPSAIAIHDTEKILYANETALKLLKAANEEEVLGRPVLSFVHPDHRELVVKRIKQVSPEGDVMGPVEDKLICLDESIIDVEVTGIAIKYNNKNATQVVFWDITDRKKTEKELKLSETRLKNLIEQLPVGMTVFNPRGQVIVINKVQREIMGIAPEQIEVMMKNYTIFEDPQLREKGLMSYIEKGFAGTPTPIPPVLYSPSKTGLKEFSEIKDLWLNSFISPIKNEDGSIHEIVLMFQDITEQKTAEENLKASLKEKETLLKEIHHRVKNNFQLVISLLALQEMSIKDAVSREILQYPINRIKAMSLIHERLYQSKNLSGIDLADYINTIANELYFTYVSDPSKIELNITADNIELNIDQAIPCGLIINELVVNSLKHAFPLEWQNDYKEKGKIIILLNQKENKLVELIISDNGIGLPPDLDVSKVKSLGLQIVPLLARNQLQGEFELIRNSGTTYITRFRKTEDQDPLK